MQRHGPRSPSGRKFRARTCLVEFFPSASLTRRERANLQNESLVVALRETDRATEARFRRRGRRPTPSQDGRAPIPRLTIWQEENLRGAQ